MERMISIMQEKLKKVGADSMLDAARAKLKEVGGESVINTSLEKLKGLFLVLQKQNFVERFTGWLDEAFPPETRRERLYHWIHLASRSPFIIIGLALLVFLLLCSSGRPGKTMKAPGTNRRIDRRVFEANPKAYFRNLHAKNKRN